MAESKTVKAMDKAVTEGTAGEAKKADERAKQLVLRAEQTYLELAEVLVDIRDRKLYLKILDSEGNSYTDFKKYVEGELNMAARKGMYLMNVYDKLVTQAKLPKASLESIPFSKAREFAPLVNDIRDAEFWVEKAKNQPYNDLLKDVKEEKRKTGVTPQGEVTFKPTFVLFKDQYDNLKRALKQAGKDADSEKEGHLLDLICTAYLSGEALDKNVDDDGLKRVFQGLERVYAISIMAVRDGEKAGAPPLYCSTKMKRKLAEADKE